MMEIKELEAKARWVRQQVLEMIVTTLPSKDGSFQGLRPGSVAPEPEY